MEKEELRKQYRSVRRCISAKAKKSEMILSKLKNTSCFRSANVIAVYASLPEEVNTDALIAYAFDCGKRVCLPRIIHKEMVFCEIERHTPLQVGTFGIREPRSTKIVGAEEIELMIVPLIAADKENYRLGFGGGYYDRYLSEYRGTTVGLAFSEQITDFPFPHEAHDIPLDFIITDTKL